MNASAIIDSIGGSAAVARLCGVTSQAVSLWRRHGIPELRLLQLRVLRPDAPWDELLSGDRNNRQEQEPA